MKALVSFAILLLAMMPSASADEPSRPTYSRIWAVDRKRGDLILVHNHRVVRIHPANWDEEDYRVFWEETQKAAGGWFYMPGIGWKIGNPYLLPMPIPIFR